ncbi:MAG: cytochrome b/b6 domain-containing protein [Phycisphaerae bacterium]|nr:cytochrome b/b6 domain-containing protein [Phycisphaerae bacterium]
MIRSILICVVAALLGGRLQSQTRAQVQQAQTCTDCHARGGESTAKAVPTELLAGSVHADMNCTDCHESIAMEDVDATAAKPHGEVVEPVNCGECHEEEAEVYQEHGRMRSGEDADFPACWSCHGSHDILPASDTRSPVHPINMPDTCTACHTDVDVLKRHEFMRDAPVKLYKTSVHGQASSGGVYVAATCNDCHSALDPDGKRTAHRILSAGDQESPINHFNIPDTCGYCHESVMKDYWAGIHGKLVKRGQVDSPVCTKCHGEHGIIRTNDPRSPVSAARVAEATCAPCHESDILKEKYGIPTGRLRSYVDSYHGLKAKAGDVRVANCASCHGAHRVLPHTDPDSRIHPNKLRETCGECHPGISAELAHTPIHETATGIKTGWPHAITVFYVWLIAITIGLMVLHNVADIVRHVKIMRRKPFVVRMTPNETIQHWLLAISFIVLVLSGFALRFSEAWWGKLLFGWGGGEGFVYRGAVHRAAAVVFGLCCLWHIVYLFSQRGRHTLRDMILSKHDFLDIKHNSLFFLGLRSERPRFPRFSYMEKCEYWALAWGAVLMSGTGILLWFDDYFVSRWSLPKGVLDVMLVIHYYEAWLATLAIFVWHGYSTIFGPHVYPMNPAWISGTMPKDMYTDEHPEGPNLKGRIMKPQVAEELEGDDDQAGSSRTDDHENRTRRD